MGAELNKNLERMKLLSTAELKTGMYVVAPGIAWQERPYLYMEEGLLSSDAAVGKILEEGYLEVYIDPTRSPIYAEGGPLDAPLAETKEIVAGRGTFRLAPKTLFAAEVKAAAEVHDAAVGYVREFMRDIRFGKLDMGPATELVNKIMHSLDQNADALLSLCRLRRTDGYTYMHCVNVSVLCGMFARAAGMGEKTAHAVSLAGLFHDLGKALVPSEVLNAPRRLNEAERKVMNAHPSLGYEQIRDVPGVIAEVPLGMLHHHERYGGGGYPAGIAGSDISLVGYIVALADIYDALTSKRVYKDGMPPHRALGVMYEMREKELHPEMLVGFIRMLGVYPVGSVVEMSDGSLGVVNAGNVEAPLKPSVVLVRDAENRPLPNIVCDLASPDNALSIECTMSEAETGIDPAAVLKLPGVPPHAGCK
ncbi:MAG: HD-GYP domain-containing protein [Desulfovibrio sp.]|jgi:HD-GYP domain-containing protein (c-di-GMP phosphodiesterase class II)|nr:HD-GYP domain-containing protein [Desulfovibrio sp.]